MSEWAPKKVHRLDETKTPENTKCVTVTHNVLSIYPLSVFSVVFPLLNSQTCLITLCRFADLQQHLCHLHHHHHHPSQYYIHQQQHHNHNYPSVITLCRLPDLVCLDNSSSFHGVMTIILIIIIILIITIILIIIIIIIITRSKPALVRVCKLWGVSQKSPI